MLMMICLCWIIINKPQSRNSIRGTLRLLYIMLAFFEHFSEVKALSIIRAF